MSELDLFFAHATKQQSGPSWGRVRNEAVVKILTEFTAALLDLNPAMVVQRKPWIAGAHRQHQSIGYREGFNKWAVKEHARRFERPVFRSPDSVTYLIDIWVEKGSPTSESEKWRTIKDKYDGEEFDY